MNALRFRPAFEPLDRRDLPSATAPIVTFEYLVVAAAPAAAPSTAADDVWVDGKIITADNQASSSRDQHIDVLSFHWGATVQNTNEKITIGAGRTESPGNGDVLIGIDYRPR